MQLSEMRDYYFSEVNELSTALAGAQNEVSMQGALIIALTRKVSSLEKELDIQRTESREELLRIKSDHREELTQLYSIRQRESPSEQHADLTRRALLAEAEVTRLTGQYAQQLIRSENELKEEEIKRKKLLEELKHCRAENMKLKENIETLSVHSPPPIIPPVVPFAIHSLSKQGSNIQQRLSPRLNSSSSCETACGEKRLSFLFVAKNNLMPTN